jgi:hypothetical protein
LISCWDADKYNNDIFLGQVSIPLKQIKPNEAIKMWYPLQPRPGSNDKVKGKIKIEIHLLAVDTVRIHYSTSINVNRYCFICLFNVCVNV